MGGGPEFPRVVGPCAVDAAKNKGNKHLRGIVDMGSNGIRLSVSDLTPPMSRVLPTLVSYRLDISLYSAQYDEATGARVPIPKAVIERIVAALMRFKVICRDLRVPEKHIRIIATEATRTAINSAAYRRAIRDATGLEVEMLAKEEEGYVGALGVASGFSTVSGLVMDLGGGSTQITWMRSIDGQVEVSPQGSVSFPYGAAALTRKLVELREGKSAAEGDEAVARLRDEMVANFRRAYDELAIPADMVAQARSQGGFPLYLSGGGFRGWGYLLLYLAQSQGQQYPISIINGFRASRETFQDVETLKKVAREAKKIFRVSDRRRAQVPAVAFLVNVLTAALPHGIKEAHFCQGGVREGALFRELPQHIRDDDPLEVATENYGGKAAGALGTLLLNSVPAPARTPPGRAFPASISPHVIHSLANVLYVHAAMSKEIASTAALNCTSSGFMAATHGISHSDRALLALMLEERYEGELPPRDVDFKRSLRSILTPEEIWWTCYLGAVGLLISKVYPGGNFDQDEPRMRIAAEWASGFGKRGDKEGLRLIVFIKKVKDDPMMLKEALDGHVSDVKKVGKRKNWIGGKGGWGMSINVKIREVENMSFED